MSDKEFSGKYKGIEVWFSLYDNMWHWEHGHATSYDAVVAQINKSLRESIKDLKAIYLTWNKQAEIVTITSLADETKEAWIKREDGQRKKVELSSLFANTDANQKIIKQYRALMEQAEKTRAEMNAAVLGMELLDVSALRP